MSGLVGFEHIGMTSGDLDRTIAFYCDLLGLRLALRKPNLAFLDAGGGMLEVFGPEAGASRARDVPPQEAGMRHLTLACSDVDAMIDKLDSAGVPIVERPRDAHNTEMVKRVAFIRDPDGIMVELIERADGR